MKKLTPLFLLCLVLFNQSFAGGKPEKIKTDGITVTVLNYGAMMEGTDVKGYYTFEKVDKADKKNFNYRVEIADNNFNKVNDFEIVKPKQFTLQEATYNGEAFLFLFLDLKGKRENLISFDGKGKQIKDLFLDPMDKLEFADAMSSLYTPKANENVSINALPGKGFIKLTVEHDKKLKKTGYSITLYSNNLTKVWSIVPDIKEQHKFEKLLPLFYDSKYLICGIMAADKVMVNNVAFNNEIVVFDLESGKRLFQTPLKDKRYNINPAGAFYDATSQNFVMIGDYTDAENKISGRSNGLAMLSFDATGAQKEKKFMTWDKDVSKFLPISAKGTIQDGGYVGFEKMFGTADGHIFAVAEQYKKVANAMGIASAILNGNRGGQQSLTNIKLMDIMVFEFNPDFTIKNISSYDKVDRQIQVPPVFTYMPLNMIGIMMKHYGMFDYNFLTLSSDRKQFTINYDIYSKKRGDPIKLGNLVYTPEGKLVESKVELKEKPDMYAVFPAKWGYLGITEYSKKQKKMDSHLEKLDY